MWGIQPYCSGFANMLMHTMRDLYHFSARYIAVGKADDNIWNSDFLSKGGKRL